MVDVLPEFGADINTRSQFWGRLVPLTRRLQIAEVLSW